MIPRTLLPSIQQSLSTYPIVALTGPRQSGKTTLVKSAFPHYQYVNLEAPDIRAYATEDPRGFLSTYSNKTIFDEIQRAPELFSYLQVYTDEKKTPGQYILTGSQQFSLMKHITQSLAGRIALHTLLPFSYEEALHTNHVVLGKKNSTLLYGGYPRIFEFNISPKQWYSDYVQTYLDRDVRLLSNIGNLSKFDAFIRLCAGRTGQILHLSSLANDLGLSYNTIKAWISVLEASYIIFLLKPYTKNTNKRVIKSPKLYFYDTGLAAWLLGIETEQQLEQYYQSGALFETWVISEYMKYQYNRNHRPKAFFWRDKLGREVDLVIEHPDGSIPVEIKSGQTLPTDAYRHIDYFSKLTHIQSAHIVYGGAARQQHSAYTVHPWNEITKCFEQLSI